MSLEMPSGIGDAMGPLQAQGQLWRQGMIFRFGRHPRKQLGKPVLEALPGPEQTLKSTEAI